MIAPTPQPRPIPPVLYDANAKVLTKQAKRLSTYARWNTNVYHDDKLAEVLDIAAYAYQDVHVCSALIPACGPSHPNFGRSMRKGSKHAPFFRFLFLACGSPLQRGCGPNVARLLLYPCTQGNLLWHLRFWQLPTGSAVLGVSWGWFPKTIRTVCTRCNNAPKRRQRHGSLPGVGPHRFCCQS